MLWVLKRTVAMRRFYLVPKTYVLTDGLENFQFFTLKIFVYLNLCIKSFFVGFSCENSNNLGELSAIRFESSSRHVNHVVDCDRFICVSCLRSV